MTSNGWEKLKTYQPAMIRFSIFESLKSFSHIFNLRSQENISRVVQDHLSVQSVGYWLALPMLLTRPVLLPQAMQPSWENCCNVLFAIEQQQRSDREIQPYD